MQRQRLKLPTLVIVNCQGIFNMHTGPQNLPSLSKKVYVGATIPHSTLFNPIHVSFHLILILFVHLEKSVVSKPWSKPGLLVSEPNILSQSSSVLQPRLMKLKGGVLLLGEMWHNVKKVIWSLDCLFTFLSPRNISRSDTWSIQLCINWEHW